MQLYLIRHGQSTNNARWEAQENYDTYRSSDPTLTEKGIRQAELLADFWRSPNRAKRTFGVIPKTGLALGLPTSTAA